MSGLSHVPEDVLRRHVAFAARHPKAIPRHQLLQKLVIFDFVAPIVAAHPHETIPEIGSGLGIHSALLGRYGSVASSGYVAKAGM